MRTVSLRAIATEVDATTAYDRISDFVSYPELTDTEVETFLSAFADALADVEFG